MINIIVFVLFSLLDVCNSESSVISAEDIISMKESAVDMDSIEGTYSEDGFIGAI